VGRCCGNPGAQGARHQHPGAEYGAGTSCIRAAGPRPHYAGMPIRVDCRRATSSHLFVIGTAIARKSSARFDCNDGLDES
jgi:hypothetical protein